MVKTKRAYVKHHNKSRKRKHSRRGKKHHSRHFRTKHRYSHSKSKYNRARLNRRRRRRTRHRARQYGGKKCSGAGEWNPWAWTDTWKTRNTFMPQSIVNLFRSGVTGGENLIRNWEGKQQRLSPDPTKTNLRPSAPPDIGMIDIASLNAAAQKQVRRFT